MSKLINNKIVLENVRLSFPNLFKKAQFNGVDTKYEATFLIPKSDKNTKKMLDVEIQRVLSEARVKTDKLCLIDGDMKDYDGYADNWTLKAANAKRPKVVDNDLEKSSLAEEDERIYAGCYVNAIIEFWVQNNAWGKRVNANLHAVQFSKEGEPFGAGGSVNVDDFFEDGDNKEVI